MENTAQKAFDSWVDTQSKTIDNFVETTKKFQESMTNGKPVESGMDIYKDWYEKQKGIMESTFSKDFAKNMGFPELPGMQGMESMKQYFDQFVQAQEQMFGKDWAKNMKDMMEKSQGMQPDWAKMTSADDMLSEIRKAYDNWSSIYSDYFNQTTKSFDSIKSFLSGQSGANTFADMFNTSQVYMKMYEVWQPLMTTMKQNVDKFSKDTNMDMEWLKNAYNTEAYKEAIDRVFKFSSPEKFKEFYEQINKFTQDYYSQAKTAQSKMNEQFNAFSKEMAGKVNPNWSEMMKSWNEQVEKMSGPFTKLMPAGKEKEAVEAFTDTQEKLSTYWTKYNEMQYMIYVASQKAFDIVVQDMMENMKEGKSLGNYNDFFNNWVNVTEKSVEEAFGTEEFSKTQGDLLTSGMEIKKNIESQMENVISAYPVVSRSEADEMAQVIHDLKTRVRSMEKKLAEANSSSGSAKKTATKKSSSKKS